MRPPPKAGENAAFDLDDADKRSGFNEAPAESGGKHEHA